LIHRPPSASALRAIKIALFLFALLPLTRLIVRALTNTLGANPIETITRSTGTWTLVFLCITLAITPLRRITSIHWLIRLRRMLGLFAFFYACVHFTTFIWFDHWFDVAEIIKDIVKRPFVTIGFAGFVLLVPLAVTSTDSMIRKLGRRWAKLHRLIYLIAVLGVVHYWWLVKKDLTQPIIYAIVVTLLFLLRVRRGGATVPGRAQSAAAAVRAPGARGGSREAPRVALHLGCPTESALTRAAKESSAQPDRSLSVSR
jgi:methionine sulfoxide reductase heme-binding subunit